MRSTLAAITSATCAALAVMLVTATTAMGAEFAVAACQSDKLNNATTAFNDFVTRGMRIRRACNPEGPGERGLITANVERPGVVKRGAYSIATITAPPGTVITWFRWHGYMDHDDCRFAVELYADLPGDRYQVIKRKRMTERERASDRCRPRNRPVILRRANSTIVKKYSVARFDSTGARRIVQRVICQARRFCSSRGKNFIQTLEAELTIADVEAPVAAISPETPLAVGAWVSGDQPLRYDAGDNVGVRRATAIASKGSAGSDVRPCAMATQEAFAMPAPCPNGAGQINVNTDSLMMDRNLSGCNRAMLRGILATPHR